MADAKISALTNLTAADAINDMIPIVDVSDTPPASGNTKRISINNLLSSSPTASGALTVTGLVTAGSATITGALTAAGNSVIGTGSTQNAGAGRGNLTIGGTASAILNLSINSADTGYVIHDGTNISLVNRIAAGSLIFQTNSSTRYQIASDGIATWSNVGGVAGTAMTLNANGLGVGVVPSAWNNTYNVLDIGQNGSISGRTSTNNSVDIVSNGFRNSGGTWVYKLATSNAASRYLIDGSTGGHLWYSGAAGTAGNTIAGFSTATMTLDASGRLILLASTTTPATLNNNGELTFTATSNTNLRFSYRGSDGVTRVADLTLA